MMCLCMCNLPQYDYTKSKKLCYINRKLYFLNDEINWFVMCVKRNYIGGAQNVKHFVSHVTCSTSSTFRSTFEYPNLDEIFKFLIEHLRKESKNLM